MNLILGTSKQLEIHRNNKKGSFIIIYWDLKGAFDQPTHTKIINTL